MIGSSLPSLGGFCVFVCSSGKKEGHKALLWPAIKLAQVREALGRLYNGLWYLRYQDRRYFFTVRPNLNKVIQDFEQGVSEEQRRRY